MCRFIVNWKITILQLTVKLFHEISDLNIQRMYTILFSSSFELLGCQLNANSSFRCRYFIGVDNIHLLTCGTYHIFCWVLRLELSAPRRVWCPPSCWWYHLITVSPWWPVLHSPELRPDCPLSAHVPPPPRRVPPPAPRASAAGRRKVAKLARSLAAEHMPSVARGYLVGDCEDKMDKDLQFDVPKSLLRGDLWMYPALLYDEFQKIFFIPVIDSWYLMYYIFKSVNVNITFDLNIYWSWWYFRWCHSDNDRPQAYILDTPQRLQSPVRPGCCKYLW